MPSFEEDSLVGQRGEHDPDDSYDYHQEVANTGFGDMLHDTERNRKYFAALRKVIKRLHDDGREAHVLDIGTGTGILAMMAVAAGADSVTACEAFRPMAECAEQIFKSNNMHSKIELIKKRSGDIVLGQDMKQKANVLVAELLDTELIGEGAIETYNHAHTHLLSDDVVCIPSRAICYAQVVESPLINSWRTLKLLPSTDGEVLLAPSPAIESCVGGDCLHDIQLSQLPMSSFQAIAAPVKIFTFDFNSKDGLPVERHVSVRLKAPKAESVCEFVFYWWDIIMDPCAEITLSCAPYWAHPQRSTSPQAVPWRDHWMQAIYYLPRPLRIKEDGQGQEIVLQCNHDEFSLWFDISESAPPSFTPSKKPFCSCSLHLAFSRSRIGQLNQSTRNKRFLCILEEIATRESHILFAGDGTMFGLAAAKLGAGSVLMYQPSQSARSFLESLSEHNKLEHVKIVPSLEEMSADDLNRITHVFVEPYFVNAILPWNNLVFRNVWLELRDRLSPNVQLLPRRASICAVPVEFSDLHKTRMPVGMCEGFDLTHFDNMVEISAALTRNGADAEPLWEYPCKALAKPTQLLTIDLTESIEREYSSVGETQLTVDGTCNGVALWVDWNLLGLDSPRSIVSTGPVTEVIPGQIINWDKYTRQGVHFITQQCYAQRNPRIMRWSIKFNSTKADASLDFEICSRT